MPNSQPPRGNMPNLKFCGSPDQIKRLTWGAGVRGVWSEKPPGIWQFRLRNGAVMSWSSTKGTVWFGGPREAQDEFYQGIKAALHDSIYSAAGRHHR